MNKPVIQSSAAVGMKRADATALGAWLVLGAALVWSTGGLLARMADVPDPWTTVFWRTGTASLFLLGLMLWQEGVRGTWQMIDEMGWPGLAVSACFATASTCFVVALQYTTVANILLMQAGVPLLAAGMAFVLFREPIRAVTWFAIFCVICGVGIMVSDSFTGQVSPIGDSLSLLIAFSFASATIITRRYSHLRMTPAVFFGAAMGWLASVFMKYDTVPSLSLPLDQLALLIVFGLNLGIGMLMFSLGAKRIPSSYAALLGTAETVAGPLWVWMFLNETPALRTLIGGSIIFCSIVGYLAWQIRENRKIQRVAPTPN
jgi:drug/metabolite transporter (DMT)-like permease